MPVFDVGFARTYVDLRARSRGVEGLAALADLVRALGSVAR